MAGKLGEYRHKRDPGRTPEPIPDGDETITGDGDTFVVQEHHASHLHWDLRLERDGVLVSWAVPKGLPNDPESTNLAVHTEDHPLAYAGFEGVIPAGEYGAGRMRIWDHGRYETLHWNDHRVEFVLHGTRVQARYELVNSHDADEPDKWMLRRTSPPEPGWERLPAHLPPMVAHRGALPSDGRWAYEFDWSGRRAGARIRGGRVTFLDAAGESLNTPFPELRALGEHFGSTEAYLDGEIIVLKDGRPDTGALRRRAGSSSAAAAKRLVQQLPAVYIAYDLLHLDGLSRTGLPYLERRALLADLDLSGPHWQTPEHYLDDGAAVQEAGAAHGLAGVVAKRADSLYVPGERTRDWIVTPTASR
jgi:bifunctional non-homologous end joining protein LigD